jgi:hypothetical protein
MWEKSGSMVFESARRISGGKGSETKMYGGQEVPVTSDIDCSNEKGVDL